MSNLFTRKTFAAMLQAASQKIESCVEEFNKLDSATGDGDHGTSIVKAIRAAAKSMCEAPAEQTFQESLHATGWAVMGEDCGSTSSLLGSFFTGMSEVVTKEELTTSETIAMFEAGLAGIMKHTKAKVGDKTLMDALIPAIDAMKGQENLAPAFQLAAQAATSGAKATKDFVAKFGRARNLGERSVGHIDAGATSMSYIFTEFAKSFT